MAVSSHSVPLASGSVSGFALRVSGGSCIELREGRPVTAVELGAGPAATALAELSRHPTDPSLSGLRNLGRSAWTATTAAGERRCVEPGRNLLLAAGTRIDFGGVLAVVETLPAPRASTGRRAAWVLLAVLMLAAAGVAVVHGYRQTHGSTSKGGSAGDRPAEEPSDHKAAEEYTPPPADETLEGLLSERRYRQALERAESLLHERPGTASLEVYRGRAYWGLCRSEEARDCWAGAAESGDVEATAWLARWHASVGEWTQALELHDQAVNRAPRLGSVYRLRCHTRLEMRKRDQALEDAEKAVQLSGNAEDRAARATVQQVLAHDAEALQDCDDALRLAPRCLNAYSIQARVRLHQRRFGEAVALCDKALAINSEDPGLWSLRGWTLDAMHESRRALADCHRAVRLNPQCSGVYIDRALVYRSLFEFEQALADAQHAVRLASRSAAAHSACAHAYTELFEYERAAEAYTRAAELAPDNPYLYLHRGWAYRELYREKDAIADFALAARLSRPETAADYRLRASAYRGLGEQGKADYRQSLADSDEAIRRESGNPWAYFERAVIYYYLSNWDEAIADYTRAIRIDSKVASFWRERAVCYAAKGDHVQALADVQEGVRLERRDPWSYYKRAEVYRRNHEYDRAIADETEAIHLFSRFARSFLNRGLAQDAKGEPHKALADFTEAIRIHPRYLSAYLFRAGILLQMRRYADAVADCNRAIEIKAQEPWAFRTRARAYLAMNDHERALADANEAVRLGPTESYSYNVRAEVHQALHDNAKAEADRAKARRLSVDKSGG